MNVEITITLKIAGTTRDAGVPSDDINQAFTAMAATAVIRAACGGVGHV